MGLTCSTNAGSIMQLNGVCLELIMQPLSLFLRLSMKCMQAEGDS